MAGIPPELMKLLGGAGGAAGGGAPEGVAPGGPAGGIPPVSSPMSTPQPAEGEKQGAMIKVQQAMDLLEQALPDFGSESEEGKIVLQVLSGLGKKFGGADRARSKELMPAEIMNLMASLPRGPGGVHPPQAGGAPGGAPGGMPHPQPPM
jgi:hypothetical protein